MIVVVVYSLAGSPAFPNFMSTHALPSGLLCIRSRIHYTVRFGV